MLIGRTALKRQPWGAFTVLVVLRTWDEFAQTLGVERRRVLGWLTGAEPLAGACQALITVCSRIPLSEHIFPNGRED